MKRLRLEPPRVKRSGTKYVDPPSDLYRRILDALPSGVIILSLGSDCAVIFANSCAKDICGRQDGIKLTPKGLVLSRPDEDRRLSAAIEALPNRGLRSGGAISSLSVLRDAPKTSYLISIGLLKTGDDRDRAPNLAILYIREIRLSQKPSAALLRETWHLTRSETNLALAFVDNGNLKDAARDCKVTVGTARQYLKKIFLKMNVRGQVELLTQLLRVPT